MLEGECHDAGVKIFTRVQVRKVERASDFVVHAEEDEFHCEGLVVATGGLSIPKMGATSFGYDLARQFGINVLECRPALVPLVFDAKDREAYCDLAGVSTEIVASIGHQQFREKMLITHRGLSGPAFYRFLPTGTDTSRSRLTSHLTNPSVRQCAPLHDAIPQRRKPHCIRPCLSGWRSVGSTSISRNDGPMWNLMASRNNCIAGRCALWNRGLRKSRGDGRGSGYG